MYDFRLKDKKAAIGFTYEDSTPGDKKDKDDDDDDDSDEESDDDVETIDLGRYGVRTSITRFGSWGTSEESRKSMHCWYIFENSTVVDYKNLERLFGAV